jgi:hypothetical protein
MIRIKKGPCYLIGIFLTFLIYLIGQLFFFINTRTSVATICDISYGTAEHRTNSAHYFACFITSDGQQIKADVGPIISFSFQDTVGIVYKVNDPLHVRLKTFKTLWLQPAIFYLWPFAFILAMITGIYYGTKYVIVSRKPWKIYLSNEEEEEWQEAEVIETKFKGLT